MIYAISDIHGCRDKYEKMLQKLNFGPNDTLYVLGDVIDRGPDGFKMLLDMAQRPNIINLMGNHEAMAIKALPGILKSLRQGKDAVLTEQELDAADLWFYNGGGLSLADFLALDEEQAAAVWQYMNGMPLYQEVQAGDRPFVLVHGGLGGFAPNRSLEDYKPDEILWHRPDEETAYYPDKYVVFGHTPIQLLDAVSEKEKHPAKIYRKGNLVDIDCGCVFGNGRLGCLCLDTMEEIYA